MSRWWMVLVTGGLLACGAKRDERPEARSAPASSARAAVDAGSRPARPVASPDAGPIAAAGIDAAAAPLAGLFSPGQVQVPAPLAALPLSGTVDDARRAMPALFAYGAPEDCCRVESSWPGVWLAADVAFDQAGAPIEYLGPALEFGGDVAWRDSIDAAWGPGRRIVDPWGEARQIWDDPQAGLRAMTGGGRLHFRRYTPLRRLLGDGASGADLAIPILGRSPGEVAAAYGAPSADHRTLALPPTEWTPGDRIDVAYGALDGRIASYAFDIAHGGDRAARDEVLAELERRWGPGDRQGGEVRFAAGDVQIVATDRDVAWSVHVKDQRALDAAHR